MKKESSWVDPEYINLSTTLTVTEPLRYRTCTVEHIAQNGETIKTESCKGASYIDNFADVYKVFTDYPIRF